MTSPELSEPVADGAPAAERAWAKLPEIIGLPDEGFALWDVERLVRFDGSRKAGSRIIERIEQQLAMNNIGHLPAKLPTDSTCPVLLYRKDVPGTGYILHLVHELATQEVSDETKPLVHQLNMLLEARAKLMRAQPDHPEGKR
ncbi:hypothetical protein [Streptomyces sp. STCH 565 A]|uniref:hypothetical protein n=1 Tax=Streptomyces sp. STCH 565 A TaxID=2950532 RepID=UPI002075938D|nr:hypothetical protein [Streptomyces sp. STCH 565 A]MCM8550510.1 hypothetical protein [Streptomyces sp. STCH 565 A]